MKYYSYFLCWEFSKGLFVWVKTLLLFNEVIGQTEWANTCLTDSLQLTCLNLSNNRIHKLDELAELITKVPHLKTLNLSHNEVKTVWLLSWWMITWHEWGGGSEVGPLSPGYPGCPHTNLCCPAEVRPRAGQDKRPEAGGAVAEQEPPVWPLQRSGLIHQVSWQFWGMRGEERKERTWWYDVCVCACRGVTRTLFCSTSCNSGALQKISQTCLCKMPTR